MARDRVPTSGFAGPVWTLSFVRTPGRRRHEGSILFIASRPPRRGALAHRPCGRDRGRDPDRTGESRMSDTLAFSDLEEFYDRLAAAIDAAGREKESLFLAKLCMTLAHHVGNRDTVLRALDIAAADLDT